MSGKWMFRLCIVALASAACSAFAAPPWGNLLSPNNVDADATKTYAVSEDNGPWMVMASTFSGEGAEKQANELVLELRKRYKLPAYTFLGKFDPGEAPGRGLDKYGQPRKANYWKYQDEKDKKKARHPELVEVVVLVGNYRSADDENAQAALQTLKYAQPQCLEVKDGKATNQTLTGWRMAQKKVYEAIGSEKKKFGPMRHAFITRNPILPAEYFNQKTSVDEETLALNKGVPHSLLDCPGKYTVQVATFKGNAVIRQSDIANIQDGRKEMKNQLAAAAEKADTLTAALRILGWDAYQYHDRFVSIVTVGSYNSPGTLRPDGQLDLDPEIQKIINTFKAKNGISPLLSDPNAQQGIQNLAAQGLDKQTVPVMPEKLEVAKGVFIPFDVQPLVVQVPKRSFSLPFRRGE